MTEDIQSLRDDVAYMKTLAAEGQGGPIGGLIGFVNGSIWSLAALGVWAELVGLIALPGPLRYNEFLMGFVVDGAFMVFAIRAMRQCQPTSRNAKLFGAVWGGVGVAAGMIMTGLGLMTWRGVIPPNFNPALGVVFIALYGAAWMVCSLIAKARWMMLVTLGCALGIAALALLPRTAPDYMLIYAACLFLFGAAPGLYMMRRNAQGD